MAYKCKGGFTLVELIMVMGIIGILGLGGSFIMTYLVRSMVFIPNQLNMDMLATDVLDIMIEGDPQGKGLRFSKSITNINPNEITFNNQDNQVIRYRLVGNKVYRSMNGAPDQLIPYYTPANGVTMTGKNGALFAYFDSSEQTPGAAANVRRIEITLIATSGSGRAEEWEGRSEQSTSIAVKKFQ